MATKEAHNRASVEYNKRQDNIMIRPPKDKGARIRAAATAYGMRVQAFILQTLYVRLGIEPRGEDKNSESAPLTEERFSCPISPARREAIKREMCAAIREAEARTSVDVELELYRLIRESYDVVYQEHYEANKKRDLEELVANGQLTQNEADSMTDEEIRAKFPWYGMVSYT